MSAIISLPPGLFKISASDLSIIPYAHGFLWEDDNADGLGNGWTQISGTGTPSITTDVDFEGNVQKFIHVINTATQYSYYTGVTSVAGATYKAKFRLKNNTSTVRLFLRYATDRFLVIPYTPTVTNVEYNIVATGASEIILTFQVPLGYGSSQWLVDNIQLFKL